MQFTSDDIFVPKYGNIGDKMSAKLCDAILSSI